MNSDFLCTTRPKGRLRRFWWLHGTTILFWLFSGLCVAIAAGVMCLAYYVEMRA